MVKLFGYKKKVTAIFAEVKHLVQQLQAAVIEHRTIWDSIIFVIALDSLYNDFEMTITPLLYLSNKDLEKIELIVTSTEVANLAKQATCIIRDLAIMVRKNEPQQQTSQSRLNKEYFNCGKKGHYTRDCLGHTNSKKKAKDEKTKQEAKCVRQKKNQTPTNKITTTRSNVPDEKLDNDFYSAESTFIT